MKSEIVAAKNDTDLSQVFEGHSAHSLEEVTYFKHFLLPFPEKQSSISQTQHSNTEYRFPD